MSDIDDVALPFWTRAAHAISLKAILWVVAAGGAAALAWVSPYAEGLRVLNSPETKVALVFWSEESNRLVVQNLPNRLDRLETGIGEVRDLATSNSTQQEDVVSTMIAISDRLGEVQRRIQALEAPREVVIFSRTSRVVEEQVTQGGRATIEITAARTPEGENCRIVPEMTEHYFRPTAAVRQYRSNVVGEPLSQNLTTAFQTVVYEVVVPRTLPTGPAEYNLVTYYDCPWQEQGDEPLREESDVLMFTQVLSP